MTDILLIQPPIRDFYLTGKRTVPYGLAKIAANLIQHGFSVQILDAVATSKSRILNLPQDMAYLNPYYGWPDRSPFALFHHYKHFGYSFDYIANQTKKADPFLVGISSLFTPYANEAIKTAEIVKTHHPNCQVVFGGHHPTALPARVMESSAVDFVMRGEGEGSMSLLAKALRDGTPYDKIPGLVFRKSDGTLHVSKAAVIDDLDAYPFPATHLVNHRHYSRNKKASSVIIATRGCPMKCTYCALGASSPFKYRRRTVESVVAELQDAVDHYNVGFVDFEDENLSLDRQWFLNLLDEIKQRFANYPLELRAMNGLFPPSLDGQVVSAMKEAGFRILNLSLGTTAAVQLKQFQRPDVGRTFDLALDLAAAHDLQAVGYIIIGGPFQKAMDSLADLLYLAERRVLAAPSIFYPAPGSLDYALCATLGVLPKNFSCMRSSALPLSHTTTRTESITLLRLSRILNFIKYLIDQGTPIPDSAPATDNINTMDDRNEIGKQLLQFFLHDGKIRGLSPANEVFEHKISLELSKRFLVGLKSRRIRGYKV
jgi:anaerobic magnesium-protoporphyrin IX monomethyl ester cyclase